VVTPTARREVVGFLCESFGMSERRACRAIGMNRSTMRYETRREDPADLRGRLHELAQARPRFGYRRLHVLLRREGRVVNHKRIYRLYRQEGLTVRRRKRKRVARGRGPILLPPMRTNQRWSMDFMGDTLATGRTFRLLNIVDDFSRECVVIDAAASLPGTRVVRVLDELAEIRGLPETIVIDNGPEFTSRALDEWAYRRKVRLLFITPGRPIENAYVESFNGKFRDECLNEHWFLSLDEVRAIVESWRIDYNRDRPHSSLGDLTPEEFAAKNVIGGSTNSQQTYPGLPQSLV
jgi:putative transposase